MQEIYWRTLMSNVISIKLLWNFTEIALRHGCSPVNLMRIFRIAFALAFVYLSPFHIFTHININRKYSTKISLHLHAFYWFFYKHSCLQHMTTKEWPFLDTWLSTLHCFCKSNRIKEKILMCYFFIYCLHSFVSLENHYMLFFQLSFSVA